MTHVPKQVSPTLPGFYAVEGYPEIACSINGDILFLHNLRLAPATLNCYSFEQKMKESVTMGEERKTITVARAWWLAFFGPIPGNCLVTGCWVVCDGDKIVEGPYCSVADIKRRGNYTESIETMRKKLYGTRTLGGKKFKNIFTMNSAVLAFMNKAVIIPANQLLTKGI